MSERSVVAVATITREFAFDMGHCLPDHEGGCYRPHGHRYRFTVSLDGPLHAAGAERDMVLDFQRLKNIVDRDVIDVYDHMFAMDFSDPRFHKAVDAFHDSILACAAPPTAEFLVADIARRLERSLAPSAVELWETPTCSASWRRS